MAAYLGHILDWKVESDVVQANVVNHTGASGFSRLAKQAFFQGIVPPELYVIVDDFIGQGGTIANLRGHIHEQVRVAKARLDNARRDFEKVRWSSSETDLDFNEWLTKHGHSDLVIGLQR
ncbi:hypothetical protein [Duganella sp. BuS-21]|uniref:hypothetical protein n=1 Tax=Duganella sp. BuS-21 TaxID=2943848 RepID=UPI0035A710AB